MKRKIISLLLTLILCIPLSLFMTYVSGDIASTLTDTFEWDPQEGANDGLNGACRVNETEYYLLACNGDTGADNDGFLRTLKVWNNNGTIKKSVVDIWEYDTTDGYYGNVKHIPGTDKYVVLYKDTNAGKSTLKTVRVWENNGTIQKSAIDTQQLTQLGSDDFLLQFNKNVWIAAYQEATTVDGFIETYWIDTNGLINNTYLDIQEFDTGRGNAPYACVVDSDTIAITYDGVPNYELVTYNITSNGIIANTQADLWAYDANSVYTSCINKIGSDTYAITFDGSSLLCKTVTISNEGKITKSFIDTLTLTTGTQRNFLETFVVQDSLVTSSGEGILGVTFKGADGDGFIYTWNTTNTGVLGNDYDYLEFETDMDTAYSHVEYVNRSWYLIVYTGPGGDGWSCTLNITTNWPPVARSPYPADKATNVGFHPLCRIDITDYDGGTMNVTFAEKSTGSWVNRQTNHSVSNGTYRWTYSQASTLNTTYYWRVYVNDRFHNKSYDYSFTTVASAIPPNPPTTFTATAISRFRIDLSWTKGTGADRTYITAKQGSYPTSRTDGINIYNNTGTSYSHTGLTQNQHWYYRAYSWNTTYKAWSTTNLSATATTLLNTAPNYGAPSPINGSIGESRVLVWSIPINDANGDAFSWWINCSNGQKSSGAGASNGTKTLSISGLAYSTTYTVRVNATDSYNWTRRWYVFTTRSASEPGNPVSFTATAISRFRIDLSWSKGANTSHTYIVAKLNSYPTSRTDGTNIYNNTGTSYSHTGLTQNQHWYYRAWSWNATNKIWSTGYSESDGITIANSPPNYGTTSPINNSINQSIALSWSIPINDTNGDTFSWWINCSNGQKSSGAGASNGTKTLAISGLSNSTTYTVWVNSTDFYGASTRKWYRFTTTIPSMLISHEFPPNGFSTVRTSEKNITVMVQNVNAWTIATSPDIGSSSGNASGVNKVIGCPIDLYYRFNLSVIWWLNVTGVNHVSHSYIYTFMTNNGTGLFTLDEETNISLGIGPIEGLSSDTLEGTSTFTPDEKYLILVAGGNLRVLDTRNYSISLTASYPIASYGTPQGVICDGSYIYMATNNMTTNLSHILVFTFNGTSLTKIAERTETYRIRTFTVTNQYIHLSTSNWVANHTATAIELTPNVYAQWHLNETSGTNVADASENGRSGTTVNSPTWVSGKINNCLSFNGATQYVNCSYIASFERTASFSYEFWFNTTSADMRMIVSKYESGTPSRGLMIYLNTGHLYFDFRGYSSGYLAVDTTGTFNDGTWHHGVITYAGTSKASGVKIYVDGSLQAVTIVQDALSTSTLNNRPFNIGRRASSNYFNGKLDEIVIYDKVLSLHDVLFRYNAGTGREDLISNTYELYSRALHFNGSGFTYNDNQTNLYMWVNFLPIDQQGYLYATNGTKMGVYHFNTTTGEYGPLIDTISSTSERWARGGEKFLNEEDYIFNIALNGVNVYSFNGSKLKFEWTYTFGEDYAAKDILITKRDLIVSYGLLPYVGELTGYVSTRFLGSEYLSQKYQALSTDLGQFDLVGGQVAIAGILINRTDPDKYYIKLLGDDIFEVESPTINLQIAGDPAGQVASHNGITRYLNASLNPEDFCNVTASIRVPEDRRVGRYYRMENYNVFVDSGNNTGAFENLHEQYMVAQKSTCFFTGEYSQVSAWIIGHGTYAPYVSYAIYNDTNGKPGTCLGYTDARRPGNQIITDGLIYYPISNRIWYTANITYDGEGNPASSVHMVEADEYWIVMATNDSDVYDWSQDSYWMIGTTVGSKNIKTLSYNVPYVAGKMTFPAEVSDDAWAFHPTANHVLMYASAFPLNNPRLASISISSATMTWYNGSSTTEYPMTRMGSSNNWTYNITGLSSGNWYSFDVSAEDEYGNFIGSFNQYRFLYAGLTERIWFQCGVTPDLTSGNASTDLYSSKYALFLNDAYYAPTPDPGLYGDNENSVGMLRHEQGIDGTNNDTGYWLNQIPTDIIQERYCLQFAGGWWDKDVTINGTISLKNVHYHLWTGGGANWSGSRVHYGRGTSIYDFSWNDKSGTPWGNTKININASTKEKLGGIGNRASNYSDSRYHLLTGTINMTGLSGNNTFDSNSIYNFFFGFDYNSTFDFKNNAIIVNNRSYMSYILFNLPDNTTLQGLDSDGDGVNDYNEVYVNGTCPFIADTDGDGYNDSVDAQPNNYHGADEFGMYDVAPENDSTHIDLQPTCSVKIYGRELYTVTFASNCTGPWINYQTNISINGDTSIYWNFMNADENEKTYWWRAYCNNGTANLSETYHFTTLRALITNVYPANNSINVERLPTTSIDITHPTGRNMDVYWYGKTTGDWVLYYTVESVGDAIYVWDYVDANDYNTVYYWKVAINDSITNVSEWFTFTTMNLSNNPPDEPSNPLPANNSDYVNVYNRYLNVTVTDHDADGMTVYFYWGDGTAIAFDTIISGGTASVYLPDYITPNWLKHQNQQSEYTWYAIANDSLDQTQSKTWHFKTSYAWDVNQDRNVDYLDISSIVGMYGSTVIAGSIGADINEDGNINYIDVSSFVSNYGISY